MKVGSIIRSIILVIFTFIFAFLGAVQLMKIQIVDGDYYASQNEKFLEGQQSIAAARGQIADASGNVLISNKSVYKVIVQKAFFPSEKQNDIIAQVITILEDNHEEWNDSVPISATEPFTFNSDADEKELDKFKENIKLNVDASEENCIKAMAERYSIDTEKYDRRMTRLIAGVRYEMVQKDFSADNRFVFADDISIDTVLKLKEKGFILQGVEISQEPVRVYNKGDIAPHVLGTIGAISEEEYQATLDASGNTIYTRQDVIGKTGLEYGMESTLKGLDGIRTIIRSTKGEVVSDTVTESVQPGNSIKITIESKFQEELQKILYNHINWLHYYGSGFEDGTEAGEDLACENGRDCDEGAVVVLDVKTGAVLGMASYPTYDLLEYEKDPLGVANGKDGMSMYNIATDGLFRPGSTFKTINAAAGLSEGLIDPASVTVCTQVYTYYSDYQPKCLHYHGGLNVSDALYVSCNIFFYDLARRMGIDTLSAYAGKFGFGTNLGIEIHSVSGQMTTVENYETMTDQPWDAGQVLQAGIGQSVTQVTPLHLAVQALTLANNGTRLKPYLVDSVWNYDYSEMISKTEPTIVDQIDDNGTNAFETIRDGMKKVRLGCYLEEGGGNIFDYLPQTVALKTGSPQQDSEDKYFASMVIGYYPAEDPQIAFAVSLSKANYAKMMVRNIIDAYFYDCYEPDIDSEGNIVSPWKRWTDTNKTPIR